MTNFDIFPCFDMLLVELTAMPRMRPTRMHANILDLQGVPFADYGSIVEVFTELSI